MESFSRRMLQALVCGAAGPLTAWLAIQLLAPVVLGETLAGTDSATPVEVVGSVVVGVFLAGLVLLPIAGAVGLAATAAALGVTHCPRPVLAWLTCLVALPLWNALVESAAGTSVDWTTQLALLGVVPMAVRLVFGVLAPASRPEVATSGGGTLLP